MPFPRELPSEAMSTVARAVLARDFSLKLVEPAYDVVGYGFYQLGLAVDELPPPPKALLNPFVADAPELTDEQLAAYLEAAANPTFGASYGDKPEKALPWPAIVKAVLKILIGLV